MNKQRRPEDRLVYLYCSSIFSGVNAQVRQSKQILRLLEEHSTSISALTKEYTLPAIVLTAKGLLGYGVFESSRKAKQLFPDLFEPTQTQKTQRATSDVDDVNDETQQAKKQGLASTGKSRGPKPEDPGPKNTKFSEEEFQKLESVRIKAAEPQ